MNQYRVVYYHDKRGRKPVQDFIDSQDRSAQAKFTKLFDLLQIYGPGLMMPYARYLGESMYELRIRGKNEIRVFYICIYAKQIAVLLHAFKKRTQKLPAKELKIARTRKKELTGI